MRLRESRGGGGSGGTWRHRKKDGSVIDVEITSQPLTFGERRAEIVLAREVTEQRRAEAALRASEERFRLLVGSVRDYAIFMLDPAGRVESWSEGAQRIKGYAPAEILGEHFSCFYPPEALAAGQPAAALRVAADTGRFEEENWRVRKDGTRFWADVLITAVRDEHGKLLGFAKVTRDLTAQKQAEEALRASERRLAQLLEAIPVGVFVLDAQGKPYYANEQAQEILGRGIVPGAAVHDLPAAYQAYVSGTSQVYPGDQQPIAHALAGRKAHATMDIRRPDRTVPIDVWAAPVLDAAGRLTHAVAAFSDISERERARTEIERLNQELTGRIAELQTANAELDAFAYSVSHDLRAPLRSIDGFSLALLEDSGDQLDEAGRDHLRRVRAATQRMGVLIDDLLKLARVTRAQLRHEPVDLTALARRVVAELRRGAPQRAVDVTVADGLVAEGDPRLLRVVLENLLGNAWKYTTKQSRARIEFAAEERNGGRAFYVRDDGAGFDMAHAGKLFGAFQRLHSGAEFEGTGVGLATVQRIVHRHGGKVWAEGTVGGGATFYFTL